MKIKKLELHNIASIEDAVIDFDQQPLSDTDLFLITGTTGAGKTTILDGISLALYNTTPRIAKGMQGRENANDDNLTGVDPRNIVRQNTGYAFSRLFFVGNDGNEYCAEWNVSRGKKRKADSALSTVVWSVTDLSSGITTSGDTSRKYGEVEEVIKKAVGLDFNQFCRTTMLAQGEFTEFLKSNEKDKAAILEKISGSDIYRKIGAAIHKKCSDVNKELEKEEKRHEDIVTMSDEERTEKEQELQKIAQALPVLQASIDHLISGINWLKEDVTSRQKLTSAQERHTNAQALIQTEEFLAKEQQVKQWNETINVRQSLRNALNELAKAENASKALQQLEETFRDALGGEAYLTGLQGDLMKEIETVCEKIQEQQANASAYGNCQTIVAHIGSLTTARTELQKKEESKRKCEQEGLPQAKERYGESSRQLAQASAVLSKTEKELEKIDNTLKALDLNGLRNEKEFLQEVERRKTEIQTYIDKIETDRTSIESEKSQLDSLNETAAKEKAELDRLSQEHDRRKETINEFAKVMRSNLSQNLGKVDNVCPVCGQHVGHLKADAILDQEYEKIKQEYLLQKDKSDAAADAVRKKSNFIAISLKGLAEAEDKLATSRQNLAQYLSSRNDAQELMAASDEEISGLIMAIAQKIVEGIKVEAEKDAIQALRNTHMKERNDAEKQTLNDENAVKTIKQKIKDLEKEIKEKSESIAALENTIGMELDGSGWEADWKLDPDRFTDELKSKTQQYRSYESARDETLRKIDANAPILSSISDIRSEVMMAMPDWRTDQIVPAKKDRLQDMWIRLNANLKSQLMALKSATDEHARLAGEVQEFLDGHESCSKERLAELDLISSHRHEMDSSYVNDKRNEVSTASDQLEHALKDWNVHLQQRPETLKEDDSADDLEAAKAAGEAERDRLNVLKGSLETELRKDYEERLKKDDTTLLEKLRKESEKWKRFNSIYGSADGSDLCKIAQSYVLGSLLTSANHHLHSMAPRYRLLVTPGTLNLKLEDKYNGYATRSTNSISGGESFLVSLALALALADFGQHLGVSTLFIDEGFGTLSGEALQSAINTLKALHSSAGRQVGIISHREEIRENIPVQIKVNASTGSSASTVEVVEVIQ